MPGKTETKVTSASYAQIAEIIALAMRHGAKGRAVVVKHCRDDEVLSLAHLTARQATELVKQLKGM